MLTVDANVWVAAFDPADAFHTASIAMLSHAATKMSSLHAPDIVQLEVACAVSRRRRDPAAGVTAGTSLAAHPLLKLLPVNATLQSDAIRIGTTCFLRGADAIYAATAEATRSMLVSWDNELIKRAAGMTPSEWMVANP